MVSAYLYRIYNTARKKPVLLVLIVAGLIFAISSVFKLDNPQILFNKRDPQVVNGLLKMVILVCSDYAFAVGFRSGVLGLSLPDMTFHLAGPFTKRFNLVMSFGYGLSSIAFFVWFLTANMSFLSMWIGLNTRDYLMFLPVAVLSMAVMFLLTSYISSAFPESIKARVISLGALFLFHIIAMVMIIRDLIIKFGSFYDVKAQSPLVLINEIGNSKWLSYIPIAGWNSTIFMGLQDGVSSWIWIPLSVQLVILVVLFVFYMRTEFDFYETAGSNAQKIADIVEASKAGVEAVNTGISRTATVGKEVYDKGWGANSFFWQHLFQNRRESKLFFVNKVALIYRVFALLILLVSGSILEEKILVVIMGVTTMMVLNAIVYGGGKIVFEFNRPYFFIVPEKPGRKFAACLLADLPEMAFDALLCTVIIWIPAGSSFGVMSMISFFFMMVFFDMVSQTLGIICVRLLRNFGKMVLMFVRYILIIALMLVGMTISYFITEGLGRLATSDDMVLMILIGSMAFAFALIWLVMILLAVKVITKADINW